MIRNILMETNPHNISTVISGSYRKHLTEIYNLKSFLENKGIAVLSPVGSHAINPGAEFVLLDADPIEDERLLQDSVFSKLRRSAFLVVMNKDQYLGKAAIMEIGYALALGMQILTAESVEDPNLKPYTRPLKEVFPDMPAI